MTAERAVDVSRLPDLALGSKSPLFWAAMGVIFVEGTMFALIIAAYFYARLGVDAWPPPGVQFPHLALPTISLVLLILSCIPAYMASEAGKKNEIIRAGLYLVANLGLAIPAMVLRLIEWGTLNFNWKSDIHGSLVWTILGLHTFDTVADIVLTIVLAVLAFSPWFNDTHRKGIDFDSFTWYFLVGSWIPLYATIYIAPHIVKAS